MLSPCPRLRALSLSRQSWYRTAAVCVVGCGVVWLTWRASIGLGSIADSIAPCKYQSNERTHNMPACIPTASNTWHGLPEGKVYGAFAVDVDVSPLFLVVRILGLLLLLLLYHIVCMLRVTDGWCCAVLWCHCCRFGRLAFVVLLLFPRSRRSLDDDP